MNNWSISSFMFFPFSLSLCRQGFYFLIFALELQLLNFLSEIPTVHLIVVSTLIPSRLYGHDAHYDAKSPFAW